MRKKCFIMIAALLLCFSMEAWAGNVVTITGGNGQPGEEVAVSVSMTNDDAVSALQLSIPLDENLTFVNESETASSRLSGMQLSAGVKDGVLNIMIYSNSMGTISGSSGELLTFRLLLGDTPSDLTLATSKLTVTNSSGSTVTSTSQQGTVSIRCAKAQYSTMTVDFGSIPIRSTYTENVTVTNVGNEPLTVNSLIFSDPTVFSSTTTLPLTVAAGASAQLNVTYAPTERGSVTKSMSVVCNSVSHLNTIQLLAQPFAVNELHVGNASGISDEEVEVCLTMNNMDDILGFQIDFQLPEELEYVEGSFTLNADRKQDHEGLESHSGSLLRLVSYSGSGKAFNGNDGVLGTFRVKLVGRNSVTLKASSANLSASVSGQTINVLSADYGGQISISSPQLSASNTLAFGKVPVTEDVEKTYTLRNNGAAPLTVSRIVFGDERFSIKESLPLTVHASQSTTITVVNSDKTEGDFSTIMQIYSNDPDLRMHSVSVTGNVFAPNYLTVTADDGTTVGGTKLHVSVDNYDAVEGFQFEITSTDSYTINDERIVKTARGVNLSVTTQKVDDNTLRVAAYLMNGSIAAGDGELLSIPLTPVETLTAGTHQLTMSNFKLGTSGMADKYAGAATQTVSFNVQQVLLGDVNGDGSVDVQDVVLTINYVIGRNPANFNSDAADINKDDAVDVQDVVLIINKVIGKS